MNKDPDKRANSYEGIYRAGTSVRRYPEGDVAAFAAGLDRPRILADLGTGTGRNLPPLLACAQPDGLVVASDMAESGLEHIRHWAEAMGAVRVEASQLNAREAESVASAALDLRSHQLYRVNRHQDAAFLGPVALFPDASLAVDSVLLAVGVGDMARLSMPSDSVDAIVNRGSVFYLPTPEIDQSVSEMRRVLKVGGRLLLSLKSTVDSRFRTEAPVQDGEWRRRQVRGAQVGLEMDFYDQSRALGCVRHFKILRQMHVVTEYGADNRVFADWIFFLEK